MVPAQYCCGKMIFIGLLLDDILPETDEERIVYDWICLCENGKNHQKMTKEENTLRREEKVVQKGMLMKMTTRCLTLEKWVTDVSEICQI